MTSYKTLEADASLRVTLVRPTMTVLICPECTTRFQVPAKALGTQGRKVRCAKCNHSWLQKPLPDEEPPPVPRGAGVRAGGGADIQAFPAPAPAPAPAAPPPYGFGAYPPSGPGVLVHFDRQAQWLLLVSAVLAGIGLFLFEREALVALWPATAKLYEGIGLPVDLPGAGLEFQNVQSYQKTERGRETLFVEGRVANLTQETRPVPQIAVSALDAEGHILRRWVIPSSHSQLSAGEIATFQSMEPSPGAVQDVAVTFFHPGWERRLGTDSGATESSKAGHHDSGASPPAPSSAPAEAGHAPAAHH